MSLPAFTWTSRARPVIQIGVGDTRIDVPAAQWDVHRWDEPTAVWSGLEPMWLDVTCEAFSVRCEYGRQRTTDRFVVGAASIVLWNATGWADPNTVDDPGRLTMRPGRSIRVGVDHTTLGTRWLYRGFIDSMTPVYDPQQPDTVELSCIDALGEVNRAKVLPIAPPVGAGETVTARLHRLLDAASWPTQKRAIAVASDTLIEHNLGGQLADLLGQAADSAGGNVYGDLDGSVAYKGRDWQVFAPDTPVDGTIGNVEQGHMIPGTPGVDGYLTQTASARNVTTPDTADMSGIVATRVTASIRIDSMLTGFPAPIQKGGSPREIMLYLYGVAQSVSASTMNLAGTANVDMTILTPTPLGTRRTYGFELSRGSTRGWALVDDTRTERTLSVPAGLPDTTGNVQVGHLFDGRIYWAQLERLRAQLVFPGVVGNHLTVPGAGVAATPNDFELVLRLQPQSWTAAAIQRPFSRYSSGTNAQSWCAQMASGYLGLLLVPAGGTFTTVQATAGVPFAATAAGWVKITRRASDGRVQFFSAADQELEPTTWVQVGTDRTGPVGALNTADATPIMLGGYWTNGDAPYAGRVLRAILRNGIGGTALLDVHEDNAANPSSATTFRASTAQVVTVAQTAGSQVPGAILNEPFNDLAAWVGSSGSITTGRNGTCLRLPGTQSYEYAIAGASQSEWVTIGFAYRAANLGANRHPLILRSDGLNGTNHTTVRVSPNGSLSVLRGGALGATLATSAPGLAAANVWLYIELQVRLHDTAGEGTLRVNNTVVATFTGQDTKSGGTKTVYDTVALIGTTGVNEDFDDLYLKVGSGASFGGDTAIGTATGPIVQGVTAELVWRFDANDYPGTGTSYVDPRGRTWTLSAAGVITPAVPAEPDQWVPPDVCPVQWERPFARADLATRVIIGRDAATVQQHDDLDGQGLYGIEPFERTDLLTELEDTITLLARRILRVRSAFAAPRIRSVTLDARTADEALDLMSTVDVYAPSRYRCRLRLERGDVFDAEHLATGVAHEMTPSSWSLLLNLDLAAPFAAAGGQWDESYWTQATWGTQPALALTGAP